MCTSKRRLLSYKPPAPLLTHALAMPPRRACDGSGCNKQPDGSAGGDDGGAGGYDGAGDGDGVTVAINDAPMEAGSLRRRRCPTSARRWHSRSSE